MEKNGKGKFSISIQISRHTDVVVKVSGTEFAKRCICYNWGCVVAQRAERRTYDERLRVRLPVRHYYIITLSKSFTPIFRCHQPVEFATGVETGDVTTEYGRKVVSSTFIFLFKS